MEHKILPIDLLDGHKRNYRSHPPAQIAKLKASLDRFRQVRSIVVAPESNGRYTILAGHGVVEAARECSVTEINCDVVPASWDKTTREAYLVADNLHSQEAQDDDALLAELLQEQANAGYDLAALGTDDESLRQMLEALGDAYMGSGEQDDENEDETPEVEEEQTRVKVGDVWQLGRHKIACINSCDAEQVRTFLAGVVPQMVWADPPYGISIVATNVTVGGGEAYAIPFGGVKHRGDVGGSASHIRKTGKPYIADEQGLRGSVGASKPFGSKTERGGIGGNNPPGSKNNLRSDPEIEVGKYYPVIGDDSTTTAILSSRMCLEMFPKAIQFWWGANYYANALPPSKCWIVWDKENTGNFADAELAWCSDDSAVRIFRHMWNGLMKDSEKGQRRVHPTQKPIALAEWAFEKYGNDGDVIYDPFLGSGMSVIAAENLGRTVYGCELSPDYIDVIIRRWEARTGQTATLLERVEEVAHA